MSEEVNQQKNKKKKALSALVLTLEQ